MKVCGLHDHGHDVWGRIAREPSIDGGQPAPASEREGRRTGDGARRYPGNRQQPIPQLRVECHALFRRRIFLCRESNERRDRIRRLHIAVKAIELVLADERQPTTVGRPDRERAVGHAGRQRARRPGTIGAERLHDHVTGGPRLLHVPLVVRVRQRIRDPSSSRRHRDPLAAGERADGEHVLAGEYRSGLRGDGRHARQRDHGQERGNGSMHEVLERSRPLG